MKAAAVRSAPRRNFALDALSMCELQMAGSMMRPFCVQAGASLVAFEKITGALSLRAFRLFKRFDLGAPASIRCLYEGFPAAAWPGERLLALGSDKGEIRLCDPPSVQITIKKLK